jgi:MtfA peptidase
MGAAAALLLIALVIFYFIKWMGKRTPQAQPSAAVERQLLQEHVLFYQQLSDAEKDRFLLALRGFLEHTRITGVNTVVENMDTVFVAAAAIIPVFAFGNWSYNNINEVLLYPDSFDDNYRTEGEGRHTLGMVGDGPMQHVMILSRHDLRTGFLNRTDKSNTAIHEFVHLVDKTDGAVDGIPEALLPHRYSVPWLKRIHQEMQQVKTGKSDINPYGTTNEAEFLAVAAEYFFERPDLMRRKHPELFALLQQVFIPAPPSGVQ